MFCYCITFYGVVGYLFKNLNNDKKIKYIIYQFVENGYKEIYYICIYGRPKKRR